MSETHAKSRTVVAGVIERDGHILICQRRRDDSHALKWEFPGGKVESGESPRAALKRELNEELGIEAEIGLQVDTVTYRYPGKHVFRLLFFRVSGFEGEPVNQAFEQFVWERPERLTRYDFLEADEGFVRKLALR